MRSWSIGLLGAGLACASPAFGLDLAGAGEEPGLLPSSSWLAWGNDYQGNAPSYVSDDYRTNRFDVGLRIGSWRLAVDWSNLTNRTPQDADPDWGAPDPHAASRLGASRIDELTASLQWQVGAVGPTGAWAAAGPLVRVEGPLGGAGLQGAVHTGTDTHEVELPYERSSARFWPGAAAQAGWGRSLVGPWVVQGRAATTVTARGEGAADLGARTGLVAGGSAVWLGPVYAWRGGSPGTRVAAAVADHEEGLWMAGGLEVPAVVLSVGARLGGDAVEGRLTVRHQGERAPTASLPLEAEAGVIPWGTQPRANEWTLRVLGGLPGEGALRQRLRVTLDGLRGDRDSPSTHDVVASVRRYQAGAQLLAWPVPRRGFLAVPYAGLAGGLLDAEVHPISRWQVIDAVRHRTAVASAEGGIRVGWAGEVVATGVSGALAWVEVDRARAVPWRNGAEAGTQVLATDGTEGHLRWWVVLGW